MTASTAAANAAASQGTGRMVPIADAAAALGISVKYYKKLHRADPASYPADRVGVLWRVPDAYLRARTAWPREGAGLLRDDAEAEVA